MILVTGSTDGIGKAAAKQLVEMGEKVIVHGRDPEKAVTVSCEIEEETGCKVAEVLVSDLSTIAGVRKLAADVQAKAPKLNVLVNNAGIFSSERVITPDGFESTCAVNYLAPFMLTHLLFPLFSRHGGARVVNVTSTLHRGAPLDFDNLQGEQHYDGYDAYGTSKLALVLFTFELAARVPASLVTVNCVHPGGVNTKLLREGFGGGGISPDDGASPIVRLAQSEDVRLRTGAYFNRMRLGEPDERAYDVELRGKLWRYTEEILRLGMKKAA